MVWPSQQTEKKKSLAIKTARKRRLHTSNAEKGHYSNECDKEQTDDEKTVKSSNKSGSNFLMTNDSQHCYSSDKDNAERPYADYDIMAIQEGNDEHKENEEDNTGTEERNNQDVNNELSDDSYEEDDDSLRLHTALHRRF